MAPFESTPASLPDSELPLVPPPLIPALQPLVPAPQPLLSVPRSGGTGVLTGPLGLRAGWGILLFFVLFSVFSFGIGYGLVAAAKLQAPMREAQRATRAAARQARETHAPAVPQPMRYAFQMVTETAQMSGVLLAALCLGLLERRRFGAYGLRVRYLRDFVPGALWGLVAMGGLVAALRGLHVLVFDGRLLRGGAAVRWGAAWLLMFLFVGVAEEFLFRGYVQFTLTRGLLGLARRVAPRHERLAAFWISGVFWSLLFFVAHLTNSGESPAGLLGVFLAGILFTYALWRTGSLWWGIGLHMTWDWSQSFLYGVPDSGTLAMHRLFATHAPGNPLLSGGAAGPEASLLVIPVFLLLFLAVRLQPQGEQPAVEPEPDAVRGAPFAEGTA